MKMNNEPKFSCSHGEEMLAYLCDELPPYGRERFEAHLESCFECIDEFAELAVSRYSVFEWKSVEFAPMPTPNFVVPVKREPAAPAWIDAIRTAFAWNGWTVAGGTAAIMLFAVIGIGIWNVQLDATITSSEPIRSNESAPVVNDAELPDRTFEQTVPERAAVEQNVEPNPERPLRRAPTQQKQLTEAKKVTVRKAPAKAVETRRVTANERLQNSPTLGQYVEDPDESLRLSDIFDDLDSRDRE